jgi:hypothetical protein
MAKNSFFIRASVNAGDDNTYGQTEIDIGAYTDLGSSKPEILRIHNVNVAMTDSAGFAPTMTGDTAGSAAWQLTTQTQSAIVLQDNRSVVSAGRGGFRNPDSAVHPPTQAFESQLLAQDFTQGYLVAVPSLFLGGLGDGNFTEDVYFTVILECTTEPATKANAVALAVSQM